MPIVELVWRAGRRTKQNVRSYEYKEYNVFDIIRHLFASQCVSLCECVCVCVCIRVNYMRVKSPTHWWDTNIININIWSLKSWRAGSLSPLKHGVENDDKTWHSPHKPKHQTLFCHKYNFFCFLVFIREY